VSEYLSKVDTSLNKKRASSQAIEEPLPVLSSVHFRIPG
ncbi:uncharacterized protein METZ01_LOCUS411758, partial [marine metagenome]